MEDQVVPSHHASESIVTLTGDLSTGRQLRKSCRFCRSRKIRCSGETDIGCLACRNRHQKCIYEPTAAMGRPRKYPRTLCGNVNPTAPDKLTSAATTPLFSRGWNQSALFMRAFPPHEYGMSQNHPPGSFVSANAAAWRPLAEVSAFTATPSANTARHRPIMSDLAGLPASHNHQIQHHNSLPNQVPRGPEDNGGFLERHLPATCSGPSLGTPLTFHYPSTSPAERQQPVKPMMPHNGFSCQKISPEMNPIDPLSLALNPAEGYFLTGNQPKSATPPSYFANDSNSSVTTHQIISTCDMAVVYQHFKGATLHVTTQAHLQFVLREHSGQYIPMPSSKHPSVLDPKLYHTMVADIASWLTCGQPSAPDSHEGSLNVEEPLFIRMLNSDRGGNDFHDCLAIHGGDRLSPLEQLSPDELKIIYSRWLCGNPFGFLFNEIVLSSQSNNHQSADRALLATVVGWYFYLSSRSRHDSPSTLENDQHVTPRPHMPFFEQSEAELMGRTMCINETTLSTVQALVLLGAFRSVDSQSRCGWALLSVAHLLSKEYLTSMSDLRRPQNLNRELNVQDDSILGLHWLLSMYKSWATLSMRLPKARVNAMLDGSPSYVDAYQTHARFISTKSPLQTNNEWANRTLLNGSQILEAFRTLCVEDPTILFLPDSNQRLRNKYLDENKLYLIQWLMETAKKRCKVAGLYSFPTANTSREAQPRGEIHNPHANVILAVVFSTLALSRLVPFEDIITVNFSKIPAFAFREAFEAIQIISTEGIAAVATSRTALNQNTRQSTVGGEDLLLPLLRRFFPYMLFLFQALINTVPEVSNTSTSDHVNLITQLLEISDNLESFASAGLSLYPLNDFQVIEELRGKIGSLSTNLPTSNQPKRREELRNFQEVIPPGGESTQYFSEGARSRDTPAPEHFDSEDGVMVMRREPIPINQYPFESPSFLSSHSAPPTASSVGSTSTSNNGAQPSYLLTATDITRISPPRLSSAVASSGLYPFELNHDSSTQAEKLFMPSRESGLILPISNSQEINEAGEMKSKALACGVFECPREETQYLFPLDSSWLPPPPQKAELDCNHQPSSFDGFSRPINLVGQASPQIGSPPRYQQHSHAMSCFPNKLAHRDDSISGGFLPDPSIGGLRAQDSTEKDSNLRFGALAFDQVP